MFYLVSRYKGMVSIITSGMLKKSFAGFTKPRLKIRGFKMQYKKTQTTTVYNFHISKINATVFPKIN